MSLHSRPEVVVVTGAGAGLGRAIAHEFARHGAAIGLVARGVERLEDTRREVEDLGGRALVVPGDIADPGTSEVAASRIEDAFGPIDIWVNNAMTTVFSPFHEMTPAEFRRVTEVCYLGFVYGTLAALERMRPRNRGTIVQIGSALAYRSIPLQSAYCGAKHAIVGFTDSIRSELIHDKRDVHLTMVHMPALNTPQFEWCLSRMPRKAEPVPPIFQPEVGARAVYWAAHRRQREVFVGGPTLQAVYGQRVLPGFLDQLMARMAWDGQMYDGAPDPHAAANLYTPVPGHQAAHGAFDDRASARSLALELTMAGADAVSLALRMLRRALSPADKPAARAWHRVRSARGELDHAVPQPSGTRAVT